MQTHFSLNTTARLATEEGSFSIHAYTDAHNYNHLRGKRQCQGLVKKMGLYTTISCCKSAKYCQKFSLLSGKPIHHFCAGVSESEPKEVMLQIFITLKNLLFSAGFESPNLWSSGKHDNQ